MEEARDTAPQAWQLHGLHVVSATDLGLGEALRVPVGPTPDVVLELHAPRPVSDQAVDGEALARHEQPPGRPTFLATRAADGCVHVRLPGFAALTVREDGTCSRVTLHLDPGTDPAALPVVVAGPVLATVLQLRGHLALHASAVVPDGSTGAVAFIGSSGSGKSSLATLCAVAGGALLTDDLLRVDRCPGSPVTVHRGALETRLRHRQQILLPGPAASARRTGDGRDAITLPVAGARARLDVLVLHQLEPGLEHVAVERLDPMTALVELMQRPRLPGWNEHAQSARTLHQTADLVAEVPAVRLRVPWRPPLDRALGRQVLAALAPGDAGWR